MTLSCIIATSRKAELTELVEGLKAGGATVAVVPDGKTALAAVKTSGPKLVVIDEGLPDTTPIPLVVDIVMVNALTNTAVISSMTDREFHDKSEGLGVLCALAPTPTLEDGTALAEQAQRLSS